MNSSLLLLLATLCFSQQATVNVKADARLPYDPRPFGKYLVGVCTISGEIRTVTCREMPVARGSGSKYSPIPNRSEVTRQPITPTVSLKLVTDPNGKGDDTPPYPLEAGKDFFVKATADSGATVQQRIISGSVTPVGGIGTVHYRANAPGLVIIRATVDHQDPEFVPGAPVDLMLQVVADIKKPGASCTVLPPSTASQSTLLDASAIVPLVGNPTPFILTAQGSNTIAIYSTRHPLWPKEVSIFLSFQGTIAALAGYTASSLGIAPTPGKPFTVELKIPHAAALGDLATRLNGLSYSQFAIQGIGSDKVRITAPTQPDCDTWTGFLSDIRQMSWQVISQPLSTKLFYLSSADVATALTGLYPTPSGNPSAQTPSANTSGSQPAPSAAQAGPANATIAVTQPAGSNIQINSDTTPCVVAGLATGVANACGSTPAAPPPSPVSGGATSGSSSSTATPKTTPPGTQSLGSASSSALQAPPDLIVFSDTNPGDDAQIQERNRVIAQLDLPRPEMIINAWVTQNSSASQEAMGAYINMVKALVADYNNEFEKLIIRCWQSLKTLYDQDPSGYYNQVFRSYIEDRFIDDTFEEKKAGGSAQDLAQTFLDKSQAKLTDPIAPNTRTKLGICERGRYCLGYRGIFVPKPGLTDVLLNVMASQNPAAITNVVIANVEGHPGSATPILFLDKSSCSALNAEEKRARCNRIWDTLDINHVTPPPAGSPSCTERDYRGLMHSLFLTAEHEPRIHLQCLRDAASLLLTQPSSASAVPHGPGLLRAALADFLFNYKMSQEYPHEFVPYDLSHSAGVLNAALSPLVDAFNRDLWSFQLFVRADMQYRVESLNASLDRRFTLKRWFHVDKPSFFNDGLVSVRTISGQWTYVNTTSQSFLDASTAPPLNSLLSSIGGNNPNATGAGSALSTVMAGTPLKRTEALAAALANYQTTFAQIGRMLQLSAIPRSLATASSAEIAVTLNADESTGGPLYTGGGASSPATNTSRVASHETATRVRVDSIKLFEISSLTAIVERSRSRLPLLPPFVEIPYIGTFAGVPIGPAKEFHSSTAILSAYVVPTAADIAYGLRFVSDLIVDGLNPGRCSFFKGAAGPDVANSCLFRKAFSQKDYGALSLREFNKRMVSCLATSTSSSDCSKITFDGVPNVYTP